METNTHQDLTEYQHHCILCADYDLCVRCIRDGSAVHPGHEFTLKAISE
jgi:hypothetical protein